MFARLLNKGFRGGLALIVSLFLVYALLLYFSPKALELEQYPNLFYNYLAHQIKDKFLITFINFLCIGIGVFLINLISVNQEISDKSNYFPVFLFLTFSVAGASPTQISSQIITNVLILFSVYKLFDTYRREEVLKDIYTSAFLLSCSAFISISSAFSFPFFFLALFILRAYYWREWAIALLGFIMPLFIYECIAYLFNFNQWYLFNAIELYFRSLKVPSFSEYYLPLLFALFLLLFVSVIQMMAGGLGNTVKKQRAKTVLIWFLFFSAFGFFSGGANSESIILTWAFPLSFFIGDFLFGLKNIKVANTIIAVLLLCVLLIFSGRLGII